MYSELLMEKEISSESLRALISMNHKITSNDIDSIVTILQSQINRVIYGYNYTNEIFVPYDAIVPKTDAESLPTATDLEYVLQQFDGFKDYLNAMELGTTIEYKTIASYIKKILEPRDIFIPPILTFLQMKEELIVGGENNIVIL